MQRGRSRNRSTYPARRRWTPDDARAALADLAASGLELRAFAMEVGIDPQRLARWRRRLAELAGPGAAFVEVVGRPSPAPPPRTATVTDVEQGWFEIVLGSGRRVRVPESFDASALGRLLAVVDKEGTC